VAQVSAGEFGSGDRATIDAAIRQAELLCRYEFSVFVGEAEGDSRDFATSLHNSLVAPARSIMIMVDPTARVLEVVTGGQVRRTLSDREVELAALQMQSAFVADDYVGGLTSGIAMLAEHAKS
jgi:hypothetical protein